MKQIWYDINKTLSYNALFNFVIGGRGVGKTFGWWERAISRYLKYGEEFIYLRRYESELEQVKETTFSSVLRDSQKIPEGTEVKCNGNCYFINGELAGYAMSLSRAADYKSASYPLVTLIGFDEFLTEKKPGYLKNEPNKFLDFYETIARMRDNVIAFFIANAITKQNPYFVAWELYLPKGRNVVVKNDMLLEEVESNSYIARKKETRFGKMTAGTEYAEYSIENKYLLDSDSFIGGIEAPVDYICTIVWGGKKYGAYMNYKIGRVYLSDSYDKTYPHIYCFSDEDHNENLMLLKNINKNYKLKTIMQAFELGALRFTSIKVKTELYALIKKLY